MSIRPLRPVVLLTLLVAGCTATEPGPPREVTQERIEDILSTPLPSDAYAEQSRCLSRYQYRNIDILDDQTLVFRGTGERYWVNQLRQRCIGLRTRDTLHLEVRGNALCDLDTFVGMNSIMFGWEQTSATCQLGSFQSVTAEQVAAIRAAVEAR
ncbi:MAG: DUF6491 family protein [Pseudomonadales bacterium]